MMQKAETWAAKKAQEKKLNVAEKRMLRWVFGVTKMDRIRNEGIRWTTNMEDISKNVHVTRLKLEGYVMSGNEACHILGKRVMRMIWMAKGGMDGRSGCGLAV